MRERRVLLYLLWVNLTYKFINSDIKNKKSKQNKREKGVIIFIMG